MCVPGRKAGAGQGRRVRHKGAISFHFGPGHLGAISFAVKNNNNK